MLDTIGLIAAYAGVGLAILTLGYFVVDMLTPGRLGQTIMKGDTSGADSTNAAIVAGATLVSLGLVVFFAIFFTGQGWDDVLDSAVYGAVAVVFQVIAFVLLDLLTGPGRLGEQVFDKNHRGAAAFVGCAQFAVALPICAALT